MFLCSKVSKLLYEIMTLKVVSTCFTKLTQITKYQPMMGKPPQGNKDKLTKINLHDYRIGTIAVGIMCVDCKPCTTLNDNVKQITVYLSLIYPFPYAAEQQ